jgi:CHASE1-domain containing sensor protein
MDDKNKSAWEYRSAIGAFLLITLPFLFFAFIAHKDFMNDQQEEFQYLSREVVGIFSTELKHYLSMLDRIKTLFIASTNVESQEWDAYLSTINEYDDFSATKSIEFLPQVKSSELDTFLQTARKTIDPNYQITPPGKRDVYFPVYYLTTFQKSDQFYGLDHYSTAERREAIEEAIKSKKASITGKINFTIPGDTMSIQKQLFICRFIKNFHIC